MLSTESVNGIAPGTQKSNQEKSAARSDQRVYISKDVQNQHGHNHASCFRVAA